MCKVLTILMPGFIENLLGPGASTWCFRGLFVGYLVHGLSQPTGEFYTVIMSLAVFRDPVLSIRRAGSCVQGLRTRKWLVSGMRGRWPGV